MCAYAYAYVDVSLFFQNGNRVFFVIREMEMHDDFHGIMKLFFVVTEKHIQNELER